MTTIAGRSHLAKREANVDQSKARTVKGPGHLANRATRRDHPRLEKPASVLCVPRTANVGELVLLPAQSIWVARTRHTDTESEPIA